MLPIDIGIAIDQRRHFREPFVSPVTRFVSVMMPVHGEILFRPRKVTEIRRPDEPIPVK